MLRIKSLLATFVIAGAMAPVAANAASFGDALQVHPTIKNGKAEKISFVVINTREVSRSITVDGQTYTLTPHQQLSITAQAGSPVTDASSDSATAAKVLFTVERLHKGAKITLN